jgi:PAS domain S-box-containing protein
VIGYEPNDLIGKIPQIFYPDDLQKVQNAFSHALEGKSGSNLEYRIITKNGEVRWVSHSWSPILSANNQLKYIVSIIHNISESKLIEQKLKLKIDELERYKNITVNREIKMIELKKENKTLKNMIKELEDNKLECKDAR